MIVKERDAKKNRIAYLETYEAPGMDAIQRQGLKQAAARLRADCTSGNACRYIDNYFAKSEDWLVIHDLRIRHAKHTMQINHLLINGSLEFYIIDSRYLNNALTLNESGQCWALTGDHSLRIASPLTKLRRDIRIMRDIINNSKELPRHFGIAPTFSVEGYILTSSSLRSHKPPSSVFDSSTIIASDALFPLVWQKPQGWMRSKLKTLDSNTLRKFGQSLLTQHIPAISTELMNANITHNNHPPLLAQEQDTSHCAQCSKPVTVHVRDQSFRHMGIFQGQVLCMSCQAAARNQPINYTAL